MLQGSNQMKLISFDIGIKNMAYCIFDISTSLALDTDHLVPTNLLIQDWNILNLMDIQEIVKHKCTCHLLSKQSKKKPTKLENQKICGKGAKYSKIDVSINPIENTFQNGSVQDVFQNTVPTQNVKHYFCEKHAKTSGFLIPSKDYSMAALSKKSKEDLILLGQGHGLFSQSSPNYITEIKTKKACLEILSKFFAERSLVKIQEVKRVAAGDTDLITIGRNMRTCLDGLLTHHGITHVIMENQISPLAGRMKTVQGMLAQYYIMADPSPEIEFISSANKLKDFATFLGQEGKKEATKPSKSLAKHNPVVDPSNTIGSTEHNRYKQHKMDSIVISKKIIQENMEQFGSWTTLFDETAAGKNINKQDDLADCFLQGLWYLKREKIITYADNLKINIVYLT